MNGSISARQQGDDYQALFFWYYALKMCHKESTIEKVAYEHSDVKSFDDVVVFYKQDKPFIDCRGNAINIDCFQVKYHVTQEGGFTWEKLMNPSFVNATSVSIMERLRDAYFSYSQLGQNVRLQLVSPWSIHHEDVLAKLYSNKEGELRIDKLFDDTKPPGTKRIRNKMKSHLKIENENDFKGMMQSLRIWRDFYTVERLIELINNELLYLGFKQIESSKLTNPYTDIVRQWNNRGINEFTEAFLKSECRREGLYIGTLHSSDYTEIGLRSYYRRAENMQDETERMLCLTDCYEGRFLKENLTWNDYVYKRVNSFISDVFETNKKYLIHLDTHLSNAFLAGRLLDSKSGVEVYPVQKTASGRKHWIDEGVVNDKYLDWVINETLIVDEVKDVAIVLSVTHDATDEVLEHIKINKLNISKVIDLKIGGTTGHGTVIDGNHAKILANNLSKILKKRSLDERKNKLHIFSACPAGLMFYIGQVSMSFGKIVCYEHDFEGISGEYYMQSYNLPIGS